MAAGCEEASYRLQWQGTSWFLCAPEMGAERDGGRGVDRFLISIIITRKKLRPPLSAPIPGAQLLPTSFIYVKYISK